MAQLIVDRLEDAAQRRAPQGPRFCFGQVIRMLAAGFPTEDLEHGLALGLALPGLHLGETQGFTLLGKADLA
ncbi:hypothetical protein, partial [Desulfosarcina cetonica]|uniref:hypothetical protein n=1 Tax=Desulfosarcina cetonica TaxID=90730 RepID=UPI0012EEDC34